MLKKIWRDAEYGRPGKDRGSRVGLRIERNTLRSAPMIGIRTGIASAALFIATAIPARAEIVASTCRLLSYDGPITSVETFRCDFMQRGGNVMVISPEHEFNFLAAEQGETYIRINSIPLRFTRTGAYTLEVTQLPWMPRQADLVNHIAPGVQH